MHRAVVAHPGRRPVRHGRHHHQRHRPVQQPHRLRQARPGPRPRHRRERIYRPHHPLRPMAVGRREPPHRQALPQPVQQLAQRRLLAVRIGAKSTDPVLTGREGVGLVRLQRDPLEAEIRLQLLQDFGEQPTQVRRRPCRQPGADRQLLHVAVHPERPQCHFPSAPAGLCHHLTKLVEQPVHRPVDAGTGDDRVNEVAGHFELRRRSYRHHRSRPFARDCIQRVQQHPPEAAR